MGSRRDAGPAGAGGPSRILLVLSDDRDRQLLAEWLGGRPGFDVTVVTAPDEVPDSFDLCLCDERTVRRFVSELESRQEAAQPVFLPYVLLLGEESDHSPAEVRAAIEAETDLDVQEFTTLPVEQAEFERRLDNLLRARDASLRLAERTQQYHELLRLTPEAILLVRDGHIVYANESAAALFGYADAEALIDAPLSRYVHDDDSAIEDALDTIRRQGNTDSYVDGRVTDCEGAVREVEIAGVQIQFESKPTTQLVLRDVTEQREREQQLTLFERAIDTAAQGITIADARQDNLPLVYINEAFEEITGYTIPECLGRNCRFLQGEGTDEETVVTVRNALESDSPVSVEILNYRKDGTPFWNRLDIVPVRDANGTVTHFLGLQQDITDRIEREQRLSVLDRVLRHNVRNRGNVIQARADRIRRGESDSPEEDAESIFESMDDLLRISDQVRTFRSIISDDVDELAEHDLVALLERVVDGLEADAPGAEIDLDVPETVQVRAHPMLPFGIGELVRQVTDDGTAPLTVRVSSEPQTDTVTIDFHMVDEALSETEMAVIKQVRETPVEHTQGIEMWLIRWIVTASGGDLFVEDDGSEVVLCMRLRTFD